MEKLQCVIIEDEPLAAEVLKDYISQVPFLEADVHFADAISAMAYLKNHKADIIFLDIHLPKLKGNAFAKMLEPTAAIIFTTAYHEYALEGFELNAVDYLLKPIEFSRFIQAVNKAATRQQQAKTPSPEIGKNGLFVSSNKKRVRVNYADILYIESLKEYVKIHTGNGKWLLTKLQLGQLETQLPGDFVRIHRSYIVSRSRIDAYSAIEVEIGKAKLPIGRNYRELLLSKIEQ